jgi:hypothetical protein
MVPGLPVDPDEDPGEPFPIDPPGPFPMDPLPLPIELLPFAPLSIDPLGPVPDVPIAPFEELDV